MGPALAGGSCARSSRPPRVQRRQRLRGSEPAPSVWARALATAGDSSREKLGSARARAEPRRNRPPAPRLSGGSATVSVTPVPESGWGGSDGSAPLRAAALPYPHVLSSGRRGLPAPESSFLAPLSPFGVGDSKGRRGWSVLGPTVRACANLTEPRQGRGVVRAFWPPWVRPPEVWADGGVSPEAPARGESWCFVTWRG